MIYKPDLYIPPQLLPGLAPGGPYILRGGVVQGAAGTPYAGQVVAWLREAGPGSVAARSILSVLGPTTDIALPWISAGASVLNLAATVGFGVAILLRLNQLGARIDSVEATIDEGFRGVEALLHAGMEGEFLAKLRTAAIYCGEAQSPDLPASTQRGRLVNAQHAATEAFNLRLVHAQAAVQTAEGKRTSTRPEEWVRNPEPVLLATTQLRQAIMACALRASITAEIDGPQLAQEFVTQQLTGLEDVARHIGRLLLSQSGAVTEDQGLDSVQQLLLDFRAEELPLRQLGAWFERCTIQDGLPGALERYRRYNAAREDKLVESISDTVLGRYMPPWLIAALVFTAGGAISALEAWIKDFRESRKSLRGPAPVLAQFAEQFDGAWDDLDRLAGHAVAYREAANRKLSLASWKKLLARSANRSSFDGFLLIVHPSAA